MTSRRALSTALVVSNALHSDRGRAVLRCLAGCALKALAHRPGRSGNALQRDGSRRS